MQLTSEFYSLEVTAPWHACTYTYWQPLDDKLTFTKLQKVHKIDSTGGKQHTLIALICD